MHAGDSVKSSLFNVGKHSTNITLGMPSLHEAPQAVNHLPKIQIRKQTKYVSFVL